MDIQVGQVLDKYELLERVGQGGMAIVYRGIDRSLKRVVAIKVLHKHLADYQEARDRFEREAQAVAKLRHENILEIFDFSAKPDSEAYIVTEFIDGQTLKQVMTARPLAHPEIGAMLILQVGRALAHAHAGGILHRDVKPENIMTRSDGIVKLMDFGISHMVDLERLTVTGQLLGSPAYMAPEHVEGRPLDFRTDVFALGIVLYQLTVGKLPFEGKNPHEVLKRIAECRFTDPRTANPRIGNRLGRIILRAMAREPADRYAKVGDMVAAIEAYLDESGLPADKVASELTRYFAGAAAYEQALQPRLIEHLTSVGQKLLAKDERAGALDVFDRVLTLDAKNEKVLAIIDGLNRRAWWSRIGIAAGAALVIGGGAFLVHKRSEPPPAEAPAPPDNPGSKQPDRIVLAAPDDRPPVAPDAAVTPPPPAPDAAVVVTPREPPDASVAISDPVRSFSTRVTVNFRGSTIRVGDTQMEIPVGPDGYTIPNLTKETKILASNACCTDVERTIHVGDSELAIVLQLRPAAVIATCGTAAPVQIIDGKAERSIALGESAPIFFDDSTVDERKITVEFIGLNKRQEVRVKAGETKKVSCE